MGPIHLSTDCQPECTVGKIVQHWNQEQVCVSFSVDPASASYIKEMNHSREMFTIRVQIIIKGLLHTHMYCTGMTNREAKKSLIASLSHVFKLSWCMRL